MELPAPSSPAALEATAAWELGIGPSDALDAVFAHLSRDGIPVQAQQIRGGSHAAFRALQRSGNEHLLELAPRVIIEHAPVEHFLNEPFELIAHGRLLQLAVGQQPEGFHVLVARSTNHLVGE